MVGPVPKTAAPLPVSSLNVAASIALVPVLVSALSDPETTKVEGVRAEFVRAVTSNDPVIVSPDLLTNAFVESDDQFVRFADASCLDEVASALQFVKLALPVCGTNPRAV